MTQGIPYDRKSSFLKGAARAPAFIRKAYLSKASNFYTEDGQEITPGIISDAGDYEIQDYFDIEHLTLENFKKNLPIIGLGGDHSISHPLIKALDRYYGPIDILI